MSQNHLRRHRKRGALTQDEIAYLLGAQSGTKVSRYEHLRRPPTLHAAFAYQVIFGVSAHELFPGLYRDAEATVKVRAHLFTQKLQSLSDHPTTKFKLKVLERIASGDRAVSAPPYEKTIQRKIH